MPSRQIDDFFPKGKQKKIELVGRPGDERDDGLVPDPVVPESVDPLEAELLLAGQVEVLENNVSVLTALPLQVNLLDWRAEGEWGVLVHSAQDLALHLRDRVTVKHFGLGEKEKEKCLLRFARHLLIGPAINLSYNPCP